LDRLHTSPSSEFCDKFKGTYPAGFIYIEVVKGIIFHPESKLLALDSDPESFESMLLSKPIITFEDLQSHMFEEEEPPIKNSESKEDAATKSERRKAEVLRAEQQTRRLSMYAFNISPGIVEQVGRQLDKLVVHGVEGMQEAAQGPFHCEKRSVFLRPRFQNETERLPGAARVTWEESNSANQAPIDGHARHRSDQFEDLSFKERSVALKEKQIQQKEKQIRLKKEQIQLMVELGRDDPTLKEQKEELLTLLESANAF